MTRQTWHHHDSPLGPLLLTAEGDALTGLYMKKGDRPLPTPTGDRDPAPFAETIRQLNAYFAGDRRDFDLPLAPRGTHFQRRVWAELARIPYAATVTYLHVALALGNRNATRAVGAANGANPLSIILPCHRVIGTGGKLVGYGGGLDNKQWLLNHEARCAGATLV